MANATGINVIINQINPLGKARVLHVDRAEGLTGTSLYELISEHEKLPSGHFGLLLNGKRVVCDNEAVIKGQDGSDLITLTPYLRLPGGKGGFGSMLRAIGAQIEKTTNKEACRDLSGRRIRDVHAEKRIKDWIAKKAEREREQKKKRKEKLLKLKREPKINFKDDQYFKVREELPDLVDDALEYGLKQATASTSGESSKVKRKSETVARSAKAKKSCLWLGLDTELEEDEENEVIKEFPASSKGSTFTAATSTVTRAATSTLDGNQKPNPSSASMKAKPVTLLETAKPVENITVNSVPKKEIESPSEPVPDAPAVVKKAPPPKVDIPPEELDLSQFNSEEELREVGLDRLKAALLFLGMKCGGTLEQRADRLWSVKGLKKIPKNLLAKK